MADVWDFGPEDAVDCNVLVCLASHSNDDGKSCFPSIPRIAKMTRRSERTVQRAIVSLEESGWLTVERGTGKGNPSHYAINVAKLKGCQPVTLSKEDGEGCQPRPQRVTPTTAKGDTVTPKGDTHDKPPHPLIGVTVIEPSIEPPENLALTPFEGKALNQRVQFIEAFKRYWEYCNSGVKMPFSKADGQAIDRFIRDHPEMTLKQFVRCLYHRSMSDVNPSQQLHRWISRLSDYASGPLDRYFNPKSLGGTKHNEQRNLAQENEANLDSLLPRNGTGRNHRGVAKGMRPDLESTDIS